MKNFSQDLWTEASSFIEKNPASWFTRAVFVGKGLFFLVLFTLCYLAILNKSFHPLLLCVCLGILAALIGFNWWHDASHGTLFKSDIANKTALVVTNLLLGISFFFWWLQHVIQHHSHVNGTGDPDVHQMPFLKLSKRDKTYWYHKGQAFYAIILYAISYISWVFIGDIRSYLKGYVYKKEIKMDVKDHFIFWLGKVTYCTLFFVIPSFVFDWSDVILGYVLFAGTCGIITSLVFQLAHVVETSAFMDTEDLEKYKSDPLVIQLLESTDFASGNKVVNSLTGGLNHQAIHHLFPRFPHYWYPRLVNIVKKVAKRHGLAYQSQSILKAIKYHFVYLHRLGNTT